MTIRFEKGFCVALGVLLLVFALGCTPAATPTATTQGPQQPAQPTAANVTTASVPSPASSPSASAAPTSSPKPAVASTTPAGSTTPAAPSTPRPDGTVAEKIETPQECNRDQPNTTYNAGTGFSVTVPAQTVSTRVLRYTPARIGPPDQIKVKPDTDTQFKPTKPVADFEVVDQSDRPLVQFKPPVCIRAQYSDPPKGQFPVREPEENQAGMPRLAYLSANGVWRILGAPEQYHFVPDGKDGGVAIAFIDGWQDPEFAW